MSTTLQQLNHLLEAMFCRDERGRLMGDAPLIHILRTDGAVLCRIHAAVSDAAAAKLQALAAVPRKRGSPMVAVLAHGRAVSVCASVRASAPVHCAGVETVPGYRGQGFATHAVAAWAKLVRADGVIPFYATTFDNLSSQKVAPPSWLAPYWERVLDLRRLTSVDPSREDQQPSRHRRTNPWR